jgi:hypothetical protein
VERLLLKSKFKNITKAIGNLRPMLEERGALG